MSSDCIPEGIYAINKTYLENAEKGPFFTGEIPERPPVDHTIDFLGFKLSSPLGIPAGPLLNSKWIALAADLGYDVLLYKTIRSEEHSGHPLPNIIFIEECDPLQIPNPVHQAQQMPRTYDQLTITNSFGMPCRSRDYLQEDLPKANQSVHKGQLVIVSVVGTPSADRNPDAFIDDFIETACFATECGAKAIEVNFSCPNVAKGEGSLYLDPHMIKKVGKQIADAIGEIPLIMKVGLYPDQDLMKQCLTAAAEAGIQAVAGINTISRQVLNHLEQPALGPKRLTSGLCGAAIRESALTFIRQARTILDQENLGLALMGCGGITSTDHFDQFLHAGADIVMTATGMMWDPYLAMRYHEAKQCTMTR